MNLKTFLAAVLLAGATTAAFGQPASSEKKPDKAAAYYNFSMGHLFSELAGQFNNRAEYLNKAIDHYRAALKADPSASFIVEELAEIQMRSGRIREAVVEAEEGLKQNPDDLNLRRLLGFIYTRMIGDSQQNRINEEMLKKAIEQYQRITDKSPKDLSAWLLLGRLQKVAQNSPESEKAYKKAIELDGNNEEALTGLAMVYADVGDTKAAADLLKKVTEKTPSLRVLVALAAAYEQLRDHQNAAATLRKALEMAPTNNEVKRGLAQNLLLAEKLDESLELFQQLATDEPRDPLPHLRMSQIFRQKRDFEKAHVAAKKASEIDPNSIEIRYNEINLLEAEGKTPEAIEAMKSLLSTTSKRNYNPSERSNRVILLERLGYLHRSIDQYPQAIEVFKQIQQLDEEQSPRASVHIIETHRLARDIPKALEEARAAREKFPKDRAVLSMYAFIAADAGKREEAEKLAKDLAASKNDRETWVSAAQIYERTKNYVEMAKALDEAEKLSEEKEEKEGIHFMRGAMYEKMKKIDMAESEFRKLLALNPNNISALNYLGYMLADKNMKLNEAYEMIKKALDQDPNNGAYLDSLGWALFRLNRLDEAETYLKRALEKTPKDPTIHDHLGDVYAKQGKIKDAVGMWQRSLKEWEATPPSEQDSTEIAKIQKKVDSAKVRVAKENGGQKKP